MHARRHRPTRGPRCLVLVVAIVSLAALLASGARAAAGDLDQRFGTNGLVLTNIGTGRADDAHAVALQPNGRIVVAGSSAGPGGVDFAVARYLSNGTLDDSFGTGGIVLTDLGASSVDVARSVVVQPNGSIVAGGLTNAAGGFDFALARYLSDGSLDPSFGAGGIVVTDFDDTLDFGAALALLPSGKLALAGSSDPIGNSNVALARYLPDGSLDSQFGDNGRVVTDLGAMWDEATAIDALADGSIAVVARTGASDQDFGVARYLADGTLDTRFGDGGKVLTDFGSASDFATGVVFDHAGRVIVSGEIAGGQILLMRHLADGSLDATFGDGGVARTDLDAIGSARALVRQPDGRLVVVGFGPGSAFADILVIRYEPDGSPDPSFGSNGSVLTGFGPATADFGRAAAIAPNGDIVVVAGSIVIGGPFDPAFALARYSGR